MDNALYALALNRQIGLSSELDVIANNIANAQTVGYRSEGVTFTEYVLAIEGGESVSLGDAGARHTSPMVGERRITNATFDVAIDGPGFFMVDNGTDQLLTRAGMFQVSADGTLTNSSGDQVLDSGGANIAIPPDARTVSIALDGTISADGAPVAQLAIVEAAPEAMQRAGNTAFKVVDDAFEPIETPRVQQGALEMSNVDPVLEIARLIEVTRAYETAQSIIEDEDQRITGVIETLGRTV